ncbi:MAG: purine/pyrimidine permease [Anaerovoracaceae bacterium]|jgi:xanthine/uracil permease
MITHKLDDKLSIEKNIAYTFQHMILITIAALVMPLVVGALLGLSQKEIAEMLQRTFVLTGIISLLQIKFGHSFPIIEGPAGLWTGILTLMASLAPSIGKEMSVLRTDLEAGLIIAGLVVMLLTILGLIPYLAKLFTPIINSIIIILMVLQVSPSIVNGMFGITRDNPTVDLRSTLVFFVVVILSLAINLFAKGFLQSISTLVGVIAGWILAGLLGIASPAHLTSQGFITFPRAFAWGTPTFDAGIIITCVFSALALLPMTFTSIRGMEALLEVKIPKKKMNNTFLIHGLSASLGGIFPTVAFMPYLSSIGIIAMTGVASRTPFVWASILMILFGIFSPMGMLLASIPVSVGCGALVIIFALILGQGLKELQKIEITNRESFIIGISILIGVGAMFLPDTTFSNLPSILAYILPNGLIDGIVVALVLEKLLPKKNPKLPS